MMKILLSKVYLIFEKIKEKSHLINIKKFIEQELFSQLEIKKTISNKTSKIQLRKLSLVFQLRKKGIYFDSHEREDVIRY